MHRISGEAYRALTEHALQGIAVLKGNPPVFIYVNHRWTEMFGYTAEEAVSLGPENMWNLVHPDDRLMVRQRNRDRLMGKSVVPNYEFRIIRKDGAIRWVEVFANVMGAGDDVFSQAVYVDITQNKHKEEELREKEEAFRNLFDDHAAVKLIIDPDTGVIVNANHAAAAFYGWSRETLVQMNIQQLNTLPVGELKARIKDAMDRKKINFEFQHRLADGSIRDVEAFSSRVVMHGRGYLHSIIHDITKRKQAEKSLILFKESLENSTDAIGMSTIQGRHFYQNKAFSKLFGTIGENPFNDVYVDKTIGEEVYRTLISGQAWTGEVKLYAKDRKVLDFHLRAYPTKDENGNITNLVGIHTDISERKRAEAALRESEKRLSTLSDNLPNGLVYQIDTGEDGSKRRFVFISAGVEELHGITVPQALNDAMIIYNQVVEDDRHLITEQETLALTNMKPFHAEVRLRLPSGQIRWRLFASAPRRMPNRHVYWDGIEIDITERKFAEQIIRRRERLLAGLNNAAQALLYSQDTIPFQHVIEQIGPASKADRASIFINHHGPDGNLSMRRIAEWCAKGIKSEIDNPLSCGVPFDEWLPDWKDALGCGNVISGSVSDFSAKKQTILKSQGILSVIAIPIMVEKDFIGFISFEKTRSDSEWDQVFKTFFELAAIDIGNAIKRHRIEQQLRDSLKEKEMLLREIHHRVKNNLQVIVSLLRMHSRKAVDKHSDQVFNDCRDRIDAMSLIHESLYQSDDLAKINFEDYLKKLCKNISRAYGGQDKGVKVRVTKCDVALNMDQCVALGMVIAELISNAFKHAFPLGKGGNVLIHMVRLNEEEIELAISDNGKGLPQEIDINNPTSIGLRLAVAAVTRELGGSIKVERKAGTRFILRFALITDSKRSTRWIPQG